MPESSISWHAAGSGHCDMCGKKSDDRPTFSRSDRVGRLLLCGECAQKVRDDTDGMFSRAMRRLE